MECVRIESLDEFGKQAIDVIVSDSVESADAGGQVSPTGESVGVVDGPQQEVSLWGLLAEKDVIAIRFALAPRGVTIAVENPCVEDYEAADIPGIDQPVQLISLPTPGFA